MERKEVGTILNLISLWIRLVWMIILCALGVLLVLFFAKSCKNTVKFILCLMIIIFFLFSILKVSDSIINPDIKMFTGTYTGFSRNAMSTGPFLVEYAFIVDGATQYVDIDLISKNVLLSKSPKEGADYEVYYEAKQNLIISISPKTGDGSVSETENPDN